MFNIVYSRIYNLVLLGLLVSLFLLTLAYMYQISLEHHEEYSQSLVDAVGHFERATESFFDEYTQLSKTLRRVPCIVEKDSGSCDPLLAELNSEFPDVVNFAATDAEGFFFASGMPYDHAKPPSIEKLPFFK